MTRHPWFFSIIFVASLFVLGATAHAHGDEAIEDARFGFFTQLLDSFSPSEPVPTIDEFVDMPSIEREELLRTLSARDPAAAWSFLIAVYKAHEPELRADRFNDHGMGHTIGKGLFATYDLNGIRYCDGSFGYACYHGVMIAAIRTYGLEAIPRLSAFCNSTKGKEGGGPGFALACEHGIGHGIIEANGPNIQEALALCDTLPEQNVITDPEHELFISDRRACAGGVFMELMFVHQPTPEEVWKWCTEVPTQYQASCGQYVTVNGGAANNYRELISLCAQAPSQEIQTGCLFNFGPFVDLIFEDTYDTHQGETLAAACRATIADTDSDWFKRCIFAAGSTVVGQERIRAGTTLDTETDAMRLKRVQDICDTLQEEDAIRCVERAEKIQGLFETTTTTELPMLQRIWDTVISWVTHVW